ncbi:MAG TPA: asparagine synthase-related protein [Candidatus Limnocylindrales bacterium]|nr:asparagine synthase-related protein [Candidatus Limnocylindrales bacterium]
MSAIAGLLDLTGQPVDPSLLASLTEALRHRGPDGIDRWSRGHVALIHAHSWTTPEELGERQPLVGHGGHVCVAADARIDNREELLPILAGYLPPGIPSDAQLILAAYQRWGSDCPTHLIGDFAFGLWDSIAGRLLCARDPAGIRTLYYARHGSLLVFASGVDAVLAGLGGDAPLNEPLLAEIVLGEWDRWTTETAYRPISRLPQGYQLQAADGEVGLRRFWISGAQVEQPLRSEHDYVERFGDLLDLAVRARLRSVGPVAIKVSGGLDSSAIAALAGRASDEGAVPAPRLYSYVYERSPAADERRYLDALLECLPGSPITLIPSDDRWALREFGDDAGYPLPEPDPFMFRALSVGALRAAHADGLRVLLSGHGGDEILVSTPYHLAPRLWRDVSLRDFAVELPHFWRLSRRRGLRILARESVRASLAPRLRASLGRLRRSRRRNGLRPAQPRSESFVDPLPAPPLRTRAARLAYEGLHNGLTAWYRVEFYELASHAGVEWRFPFLDRRLVDFTLNLPRPVLYRAGWGRAVLREAMIGLLPETIRLRTTKATITDLVERGLLEHEAPRIERLLSGFVASRAVLADPAGLWSAWAAYRRNRRDLDPRVINAVAVEAWMEARTLRRRTLASAAALAPAVDNGHDAELADQA